MPIFDPTRKSKADEFALDLISRMGEALGYLQSKYQEYIPYDIRKNLSDINEALPMVPGGRVLDLGDAVVQGISAAPAIAKALRAGKNISKAQQRLLELAKKKYGIDFTKPIPLTRSQKETVDFPVSQGARKGIWASVGDYAGYENTSPFSVEGGPHTVRFGYEPKNPLIVRGGAEEYVGPSVTSRLTGSPPSKLESVILPKKEIERARASKDPLTTIEDAVGAELARRAGYDAIVGLREFSKFSEKYKKASKQLENLQSNFRRLHKATIPLRGHNKIMQDARRVVRKLEDKVLPSLEIDEFPASGRALLQRAIFDKLSTRKIPSYEDLFENRSWKAQSSLLRKYPSTKGYEPTQIVLLDRDLIKKNLRKYKELKPE